MRTFVVSLLLELHTIKLKIGKGIFIGSIWTEEFQIYVYEYLTQSQFQTLN